VPRAAWHWAGYGSVLTIPLGHQTAPHCINAFRLYEALSGTQSPSESWFFSAGSQQFWHTISGSWQYQPSWGSWEDNDKILLCRILYFMGGMGLLADWREWGCTKAQAMVMVQRSVRCPPRSYSFIHRYRQLFRWRWLSSGMEAVCTSETSVNF
jgi:hypothetical protein